MENYIKINFNKKLVIESGTKLIDISNNISSYLLHKNNYTDIDPKNISPRNITINSSEEDINDLPSYINSNNQLNLKIIDIHSIEFLNLIYSKNIILDQSTLYLMDIDFTKLINDDNNILLIFKGLYELDTLISHTNTNKSNYFYHNIIKNLDDIQITDEFLRQLIDLLFNFYQNNDNICFLQFIFKKENINGNTEVLLNKLKGIRKEYIK